MALRMGSQMPSLEGGVEWFNSTPLNEQDFAGSPTLIHFWAVSCGSCKESLPDLNRWLDKFGPNGLKILSVHMPRQESDTNIALVKEAVDDYQIKQPCVVDNWHTIADAFGNKYVPAFYLFDEAGKLRHFQAGERAAKMVEPVIERVLAEVHGNVVRQSKRMECAEEACSETTQ
jgi:thiol-disulfide isomerase/thioredoxin